MTTRPTTSKWTPVADQIITGYAHLTGTERTNPQQVHMTAGDAHNDTDGHCLFIRTGNGRVNSIVGLAGGITVHMDADAPAPTARLLDRDNGDTTVVIDTGGPWSPKLFLTEDQAVMLARHLMAVTGVTELSLHP